MSESFIERVVREGVIKSPEIAAADLLRLMRENAWLTEENERLKEMVFGREEK